MTTLDRIVEAARHQGPEAAKAVADFLRTAEAIAKHRPIELPDGSMIWTGDWWRLADAIKGNQAARSERVA